MAGALAAVVEEIVGWTWIDANSTLALGWHVPQVFWRLAWFTVDRGSALLKILCTPWQEAQLATFNAPFLLASPWYVSLYVSIRLASKPYRPERISEPWQRVQVVLEMLAGKTDDSGFVGSWIECSPWQSVQTGESVTPFAAATP